MSAATAFPLCWPSNWPRHTGARKKPAGSAKCGFVYARDKIAEEVRRMCAEDPILSTNCQLLLNGQPRGDRPVADPGTAIYFTLNGKPMVMATDYFTDVGSNIWRLAMAMAYLRGLERHGGGTMLERAFAGFAALPDPSAKASWREVLRIEPGSLEAMAPVLRFAAVRQAYMRRAQFCHPDTGGSNEAMAEVNEAWEQAQREVPAP